MSEINEACSLLYSCHLWAQTGKYKKHSSLYLFFPNSGTWYPLKQVKTLAWFLCFSFSFWQPASKMKHVKIILVGCACSSQTCLRKASIGIAYSEMWKSTYLHLLPKLWILFVCRQKPKVGRCYFVSCHMFPELFIIEGSHHRALFLTPVTKACPSLFKKKKSYTTMLPARF